MSVGRALRGETFLVVIIIMLLLNHELEGDFIRHSYTTTMMIVVFILWSSRSALMRTMSFSRESVPYSVLRS
jgi:hypothetical protein